MSGVEKMVVQEARRVVAEQNAALSDLRQELSAVRCSALPPTACFWESVAQPN